MSLNTQNQHHAFNGWLDSNKVQNQVDDVMRGADDGELYLQHIQSEIFQYSDQKLKSACCLCDVEDVLQTFSALDQRAQSKVASGSVQCF